MAYRFGGSQYDITVRNPLGISTGRTTVVVDGTAAADGAIRLVDDGARHAVTVTLVQY